MTDQIANPRTDPVTAGAPFSMGRVVLTVHDLDRVSDYYRSAIGLHRLRGDAGSVELGTGDEVLLELRRDKAARWRSPREAGLFHTAFLLPTRADLGRWTKHAVADRIAVAGASDHLVSEAIYLTDPEGNGIEIYADRPAASWQWRDGQVQMSTEPLDVDDLLAHAGDADWQGFPEGAVVGHVHLQVGAIPPAESFYAGLLGLDITCHYPGATFYAANGYHHHVATNIWNSRGAPERDLPSTGLTEFVVRVDPTRLAAIRRRLAERGRADAGATLRDPWGTALTLVVQEG